MKYCAHCGKEILDEAVVCVNCGCPCNKEFKNLDNSDPNEKNTGLKILSFFIPIVGLILFLVYLDDNKKRSHDCGKFALIGFIVDIVVGIIISIIVLFFIGYLVAYVNSHNGSETTEVFFNFLKVLKI